MQRANGAGRLRVLWAEPHVLVAGRAARLLSHWIDREEAGQLWPLRAHARDMALRECCRDWVYRALCRSAAVFYRCGRATVTRRMCA